MSTSIPNNPSSASEAADGTLGAVLEAGGAAPSATEQVWVALVRSVGTGNERALRVLYDRTHRLVFTLAVRITGDRSMSEEVTLDVFHDVWRRASGFDPAGGTVLGWIMNQARSRAIDRMRFEHRKKRTNPYVDGIDGMDSEASSDLEGLLDASRATHTVRAALAALSFKERQAIEQAFFQEQSYTEVAQHLAEPVGTVKTRIRSGLLKLRRALAPNGESQP